MNTDESIGDSIESIPVAAEPCPVDLAVENEAPVPSRKRKRGRQAKSGTGRKKVQTVGPSKKLIYGPEVQDRIIVLFFEEARRGAWNIVKPAEQRPAFQRICTKLKVEFPLLLWSVDKIVEKFASERKRYRTWKTFRSNTGVRIDPETGLLLASDNQWSSFLGRYPKARWLQTVPLGNVAQYEEIFDRESATGQYIWAAAASELFPDLEFDIPPPSDVEEGSSTDNPDKDLTEEDTQRRSTSSYRAVSETASIRSTPNPSRSQRKSSHRSEAASLMQSLMEAASILARNQDNDAIDIALRDFQERYRDALTPIEQWKCVKQLRVAKQARFWNVLEEDLKGECIKEWLKARGE
ncbi:hypothetical protein GQ53DRAFT_749571 [Thozetella sp. PMI_491]|nr:hypothetical protein GQ53DRAFT_749571 [Thozetella sp. PMI_491]